MPGGGTVPLMGQERRELCVIGAGTAGFAAAEAARAAGRDVVLVTGTEELGGTCILRGCMPAKAVLAAVQVEGEVAKAHEHEVGVETAPVHLDLPAIISRKRALVDYFAADRQHDLEEYPLVRGDARFVAPDAIVAGERRIVADRFVIATGATVEPPPIDGLDTVRTITSTGVLELTHTPHSVAIIGGGPIGCAFAQFFARLGARVTLFQDAPELLRADDPDVGTAIRAALERDGVEVVLDADVRRAQRDGDVAVLFADTARGAHGARADVVLLATNRRPHVDALDLAAGGIEGDRARGIVVDAVLRSVSNPRVFAAGDVLARRALVHTAQYGGRLAATNAFAAEPVEAQWDRWEVARALHPAASRGRGAHRAAVPCARHRRPRRDAAGQRGRQSARFRPGRRFREDARARGRQPRRRHHAGHRRRDRPRGRSDRTDRPRRHGARDRGDAAPAPDDERAARPRGGETVLIRRLDRGSPAA